MKRALPTLFIILTFSANLFAAKPEKPAPAKGAVTPSTGADATSAPKAQQPAGPKAPESSPAAPSPAQKKVADSARFFNVGVELLGAWHGCMGDWCDGNDTVFGAGAGLFNRIGRYWGWGLSFYYASLNNDDFDSVYYYNISIDGRVYYPMGIFDPYVGFGVGYLTFLMNDNKGDTYDFKKFRATAPTLSLELGVDITLFKGFKIGLLGRFINPIWSEACLSQEDGRQCVEPQSEEVGLNNKYWYAGLRLSYTFGH